MTLDLAAWILPLCFLMTAGLFLASFRLIRQLPATPEARAAIAQPVTVRSEPVSEVSRQLSQAGFRFRGADQLLARIKLIAMLLMGAGGGLFTLKTFESSDKAGMIALIFGAGLGLMGYYLPTYYVDRRRKAYRKRIRLAVPDALDFLQVCVEAGQSIDAALLRVTQEMRHMHPDLALGLNGLTDALSAGAKRSEAFAQLADETENKELRQFAVIMNQAAKMGTPITQTLRVFSADIRDQRVRETEARANVLPTKMTLGSMLFTVPPLLIVLLSPSVLRILEVL